MRKSLLTALLFLALGPLPLGPLAAQEQAPMPPPPTPESAPESAPGSPPEAGAGGFLQAPEVEPSPVTGDSVEPEITIRETGQATIYEYRVRGQMYMVRIQPQFGPPYFLIDTDGDGTLDMKDSSPKNISIPQWVLFSWD